MLRDRSLRKLVASGFVACVRLIWFVSTFLNIFPAIHRGQTKSNPNRISFDEAEAHASFKRHSRLTDDIPKKAQDRDDGEEIANNSVLKSRNEKRSTKKSGSA
jgi:hypothetical protein